MNRKEFNEVIENRINLIRETLAKKNAEYAPNEKPLHNFHEGALQGRTTPEKALFGYMLKHYVSITDMVQSEKDYSSEIWSEKIGDMINYLILLEALIEEKQQKNNTVEV